LCCCLLFCKLFFAETAKVSESFFRFRGREKEVDTIHGSFGRAALNIAYEKQYLIATRSGRKEEGL